MSHVGKAMVYLCLKTKKKMNMRRITNPNPIIKETKENLIRDLFILLLDPPPLPLFIKKGCMFLYEANQSLLEILI